MNPIPTSFLLNCIALFPEQADYVQPFLARLAVRLPGIVTTNKNWSAVSSPRPCLFGPLYCKGWTWQVVIDIQGLTADMRKIIDVARSEEMTTVAIRDHAMSAMSFLINAPEGATSMNKMRALCQVGWAFLDVGATAMCWPVGLSVWHRSRLIGIDPGELGAEDLHIFVSYDIAQLENDQYWLRTWGMDQFGFPDLACTASASSAEFDAANALLSSLPVLIVRRQNAIPLGDTVESAGRIWQVTESGHSNRPWLQSPYGIQVISLVN